MSHRRESRGRARMRGWEFLTLPRSRSFSFKRQAPSNRKMKRRGLDAAPPPFPKKDSCGACARSRGYPFLDFVRVPRHSADSKPYPRGELAGGLQPGDVRETIRNSIDCFQILLRYELPCHCKSLL